MSKRPSSEIKKKILLLLKEQPLTYAQLERKVNTGYRTILLHCKELEMFGQIKIEKIEEHPANGRPSFKVSITLTGRKAIENF